MKKCKNCQERFNPIRSSLEKFCHKDECIKAMVCETKEKLWKQTKKKMKEDLMTVQDYIKLAQQVFNKYIRLRDKGQNCISCNKPALKENAGHYFNANNHWNVRFNELNVHLQCEHCNTFLSGNLIEYQRNLIHKIGITDYYILEAEARKTRKFTIEELKEIINTYKKKIKHLSE